MNSSQPASGPEPAPGLGSGRPIESEASNGSPAGLPPTPGRLLAIAAGAGLLAGGISWLIGESVLNAFRPPIEEQHVMGQVIMKASFHDQSAADFKNAALAFAVLGGVLGAALGLAGGLARNSTRAAARAAAIGLILGVVLGIGTSSAFLPLFFRALDVSKEELSRDLTLPLLVHCGIWSGCGLAGGLAFGIGLGGPRHRAINAAIGGLIGAALGAALYELIGAAAFPADRTAYPLAITWNARLLARLIVATLSASSAAVVINMQGRRPAGAPQAP
jgi:hypothetical protein